MTRQIAWSLAGALFLLLGSATTTWADEGSEYGDWVSAGVPEFEQGEFRKSALEDGTESVVLGESSPGVYFPGGEFTSHFFQAPRPFDTVTVGYEVQVPDQTSARVQVRALGGVSGHVSRWYDVEPERDILLEGPYRFFQYRVGMRTSIPETTPRLRSFTALFGRRNRKQPTLTPLGTGNGSVAVPEIVSRQEWGARPPKTGYTRHKPVHLVVHHTAIPNVHNYAGAATVRGIQRSHQDDRKWNDIGYHFVIGPEGAIYQGRPEYVVGAHAQPNTGKVGISLVGNYQDEDQLSDATRKSLIHLLAWLAATYTIDPGTHITGHRDWMDTSCPGIRVYEELDQLRLDVARFIAESDLGDPITDPELPDEGTGDDHQ